MRKLQYNCKDHRGQLSPVYEEAGHFYRENPPKERFQIFFKVFDARSDKDTYEQDKKNGRTLLLDSGHVMGFTPEKEILNEFEALMDKKNEYLQLGKLPQMNFTDISIISWNIFEKIWRFIMKLTGEEQISHILLSSSKIDDGLLFIRPIKNATDLGDIDIFIDSKNENMPVSAISLNDQGKVLVKKLNVAEQTSDFKTNMERNLVSGYYTTKYLNNIVKCIREYRNMEKIKDLKITFAFINNDYPVAIRVPTFGEFLLAPRIAST